jgi:hypothetical protein
MLFATMIELPSHRTDPKMPSQSNGGPRSPAEHRSHRDRVDLLRDRPRSGAARLMRLLFPCCFCRTFGVRIDRCCRRDARRPL